MEFYLVIMHLSLKNKMCFISFVCSDDWIVCLISVSQFTLYGFMKGNKPDFHVAMPPEKAKPFYASFVERFQKAYKPDAVKGIETL